MPRQLPESAQRSWHLRNFGLILANPGGGASPSKNFWPSGVFSSAGKDPLPWRSDWDL